MLEALTCNFLDQMANRCQMLQVPVVDGEMMDYCYFSTDKQNILFWSFNLCFSIMFWCKHCFISFLSKYLFFLTSLIKQVSYEQHAHRAKGMRSEDVEAHLHFC